MSLDMDIIIKLILGFFITSASVYNLHKLSNRRVNFKSRKLWGLFLILMTLALINYFNVNAFVRITVITISLSIFYKLLFKANMKDSVITTLVSQIVIMISEMIFAFIMGTIFDLSCQDIVNSQFGGLYSNICISLLSFMLIQIPIFKKFRNMLLVVTDRLKKNQLIFFFTIIVIVANILTMVVYYDIEFQYLLVFNTFLTVFFLVVIIYYFSAKNNYMKVYDKYNTTLKSLKEYEDILDKYRVSNHENKNQLLTIRNMLPKTNKKIISYIDTVIENKLKDNEKVMFDVSKIPAGGLRGLIYSKVLVMKESNIEYELEISKDVKTVDLINNIDDSMMLDICKIIGVYADNAIQEVEQLEEKYINIEMYLDDSDLVISISNNYGKTIELDKIEDNGFTTKGDGHGYGLTLAKQIIENNKKLSNQKMITQDSFTQMLKIKM